LPKRVAVYESKNSIMPTRSKKQISSSKAVTARVINEERFEEKDECAIVEDDDNWEDMKATFAQEWRFEKVDFRSNRTSHYSIIAMHAKSNRCGTSVTSPVLGTPDSENSSPPLTKELPFANMPHQTDVAPIFLPRTTRQTLPKELSEELRDNVHRQVDAGQKRRHIPQDVADLKQRHAENNSIETSWNEIFAAASSDYNSKGW
jgi:hypothetical protein